MLLKNLKAEVVIENISGANVGYDGFMMVEKGIRGGICQVLHPYARGNYLTMEEAESVPEDLAQLSEEHHILYIDCNNLYGTAMCEPMPLDSFWMEKQGGADDPLINQEEREKGLAVMREHGKEAAEIQDAEAHLKWFDPDMQAVSAFIRSIAIDATRGYLLEVDLDYPAEIHVDHNDLPFCPESKLPPHPSDFTREQFSRYGMGVQTGAFKTPKLIMDLCDKKNYVIHYRMLQLALKHGLILRKVHRVLGFRQSRWLKTYIDYNTVKRKEAKNAVGKDFYKLMNNAIFGKMMENVRNRRSVELIFREQWARALKFASHPWMKSWRIIRQDPFRANRLRRGLDIPLGETGVALAMEGLRTAVEGGLVLLARSLH